MNEAFPDLIRIALADDHTIVRKGLRSILSGVTGMDVVVEAANGRELVDGIAKLKDPPHVCLLDVNMPELDGHDALKIIKERYPDVKALVLTMMDHEAIILRMLNAGANGYLLKDDEPEVLIAAIRYIMTHDYYTNELVGSRLMGFVKKGINPAGLHLTPREEEFLRHCVSEMAYKEIGKIMGVGLRTVEGYRDSLFERLGLKSRMGLAIYALRIGIVDFK